MEVDDEPRTREAWLKNNREIVEQEDGTPEDVFINSIETRLALAIELRNEADERLGDAYVGTLNRHEAKGDFKAEGTAWFPLAPEDLVEWYGVTYLEAVVIAGIADKEYEEK